MHKKILVTGVGGFIASHFLSHVLVNTDWLVYGVDSFRHKGISERLTFNKHYQENSHRVRIYTHDLTAPLSKVFISSVGQIDYIVNFASESHVDRSITDPVPFVKNNVDIALNMLEYARFIKPSKFIQISTDEVYGPTDGVHNHREWDSIIPSNPYSASKCCQEAIAISYWRTYGVPVILTNIMNQFGEMQDTEKFVPMVIKKVLNGEKVTIHGSSDGQRSGARFWLHTRNTSDVILFLLNKVAPHMYPEHARPERFNIVGEQQISNLDMAKKIAEIVNKPLSYELVDAHTSRPGHDLFYGLSSEKLLKYGYKYPVNLDESLKNTIRWSLENPRWLE